MDTEFRLANDFFMEGVNKNEMEEEGVLVDLCCGSGLMTRKFLESEEGGVKKVVALDFSEAMLEETKARIEKDTRLQAGVRANEREYEIVRGNVECLPLREESVDFIHAGAAIHCWNHLQDGLKEVYRVLKKDGKFFTTTFLWGAYGMRRNRVMRSGGFRYFDKEELVWLMNGAGFKSVDIEEFNRCAVIRCQK